MKRRIIRVAACVLCAAAAASSVWAQEPQDSGPTLEDFVPTVRVDLQGNGGRIAAASVDLDLDRVRLIARTHRSTGRSVVGIDTEPLTVGPLRLAGLAGLITASPLGRYPWSSALTRAGAPLLDRSRTPSGRFGAALRAGDAFYVYAMRRSAAVARFGAGGRIAHGSGLAAEVAAVFTRLSAAPGGPAAGAAPPAPREQMIHAAARIGGAGDLLKVTAVPIVMVADRQPAAGAGIVSAGLGWGWLAVDGSLAFADRRYFTGDAKRATGGSAAVRMRAAGGRGQTLELRSRWRYDASPERVVSARLAAGAGAATGFSGRAEVSHRTTRSSQRVSISARVEARDHGARGWLSGAVSGTGGRTTHRFEVGARLQPAPDLRLTVAAGWAGEWNARVECVLQAAGHQVEWDADDDGDWGIGVRLRNGRGG